MYMAWLPCMWVVVLPFMGFLFSGWEKKHSSCHHAAISSTNLRKPTSVTYIWKHLQRTSTGCGVFGKVARLRPFSSFKRPRNQPDTCYRGLAWTDRYRCWVQIQRFQKEEMLETPKDSWLEGESDPFSGSMLGFPEVVGIWVERSSTCWDLNLSFWNTFFPERRKSHNPSEQGQQQKKLVQQPLQHWNGVCWFSPFRGGPHPTSAVLGNGARGDSALRGGVYSRRVVLFPEMSWEWIWWFEHCQSDCLGFVYIYIYIYMIHVDFVAVMHIIYVYV